MNEIYYSIIMACNDDGLIGINNNLPWHCPEDLKNFKDMTENNIVIMGRKTFESLGSIPLPDRVNIVITKKSLDASESLFYTAKDLETALQLAGNIQENKCKETRHTFIPKIWVIGGTSIYEQTLQPCIKLHTGTAILSEALISFINYDTPRTDHKLHIVPIKEFIDKSIASTIYPKKENSLIEKIVLYHYNISIG